MSLLELETSRWRLIAAFALFELAALAFATYFMKLRRRRRSREANQTSLTPPRRDSKWVSCEIERLCSGEHTNEPLIKLMSAEERALFEVSIIDALNGADGERQDRLRAALIKHGYDEQCSRRVMSQDFSDRVRATALLSLLRPQWRDTNSDAEQRKGDEGVLVARASGTVGAPLDLKD